jgi:hypothetical protein
MMRRYTLKTCEVVVLLLLALLCSPAHGATSVIADDTTLVGLWHFDEPEGSVLADVSPYWNHALASGTQIVPGVSGRARWFNGTTDFVYIPNPSGHQYNFQPNESFTVQLWFKASSWPLSDILRRGLAPAPGFAIAYDSGLVGGGMGSKYGPPPDTVIGIWSNRKYNDNVWHMVTLVRDRAQQQLFLYVDSVLAQTVAQDTFPVPLVSDRPITIGRWEPSSMPLWFSGAIDEISIRRGAWHPKRTTWMGDEVDAITGFELYPAFPNPFNPSTTVSYQLPVVSEVNLVVFDLLGQEVAVLVNSQQTSGHHTVRFEAGDLPNGVYLCRLTANGRSLTRKMVLAR